MLALLSRPTSVCVTGGAGFIGTCLVSRLLEQGHRVAVIDDLSSGVLPPAPRARLRFVRASVLDTSALSNAVRDATLVFHLAGTVGMRQVSRHLEHSYRVAVEGTRNLLACAPGIPSVLFSSSAVYGHIFQNPVHEGQAGTESLALEYDGGQRGYAAGKLQMEALGRGAGWPVLCVRPFNVVGPGQVSAWGMVVPTFADRALAGEPLPVFDDGLQTRSFSEVGTFVDTLLRVVSLAPAWQLKDHALNIGAPDETSIRDLAREVLQATASKSPVLNVPYKQVFPGRRDVRSRVPDVTRLQNLLGPVRWPSIAEVVRAVIAERTR